MRRRTYLATVTGGVGGAVAGCASFSGSDHDEESDDESTTDDPPELEDPDDNGTVDGFADLEGWTVVAGTAMIDSEQAAVGDRSVVLETDADETEGRLVRELPEPRDWSGMSPGLALATEETVTPRIQLFDGDGNVIDFRTTIYGGTELRRCNFGVAGIESHADLEEVSEIHISFFSGEDDEDRLRVDDLHLVPRPDDGLVMLQFDAGYESVYTEALPVLQREGFPATAFVTTDLIREEADHDGNRLTESQLSDLVDAGWTIGSYTANGQILTGLAAEEQAEQITDARTWLEQEGYDGARFFSYPVGQYDDTSLDLVAETYDLGFSGRHPVHGYVTATEHYPRVVDPELEDAEEILERTAELGGITTLCYYGLEDESAERFAETMEVLADHVSAGDIELIQPHDLESEYMFEGGEAE